MVWVAPSATAGDLDVPANEDQWHDNFDFDPLDDACCADKEHDYAPARLAVQPPVHDFNFCPVTLPDV
jgi:hypothetical protein